MVQSQARSTPGSSWGYRVVVWLLSAVALVAVTVWVALFSEPLSSVRRYVAQTYLGLKLGREAILAGDVVIAIGNPRGLGDTITVGVVSALGRDAKLSRKASLYDLIQTDASINTGNSGGALLNLDGELLGGGDGAGALLAASATAFTVVKWLGAITPIGGVLFLVGWGLLIYRPAR